MKAATAGGLDVSTISSCLWQPVKAVGHRQGQNSGDPGQGKKQQLPRSRHRHAACCVGEHVYVFCGKDRTSPLKDVWKFHVRKYCLHVSCDLQMFGVYGHCLGQMGCVLKDLKCCNVSP